MNDPAPPVCGIPGTVRNLAAPGWWSSQGARSDFREHGHGSGAGYACQVSANRCYVEMAAHASVIKEARRVTRHTLATWRLARIADEAELIVSELTTNAVRVSQARTSVVVLVLAVDLERLYIMVWDDCPEHPASPVPADDDAENGRGLGIVAMLSERCGTAVVERGKVVWSRLDLTRPA